jgi:sulfite reductase (NADPH) hemoprotein beta-component
LPDHSVKLAIAKSAHREFARFLETNVARHRQPGYAAVTISLKPIGGVPGDASCEQMRIIADLAERYSFSEIRVTHHQNLVLPHVRKDELFTLWEALDAADIATSNVGLVTDIISCPGLDYCSLATARSIPIAQSISRRFADPARQREIGQLGIKISGCINACGHHHIGHIGILGLEKNGAEYYQLTLGGDATEHAALGERLGPGLAAEEVPEAVDKIIDVYLASRAADEAFIETYRRIGIAPFRKAFQGELHGAD